MKNEIRKPRICPKCGRSYTERPAILREDNETLVCSNCAAKEALQSIGVSAEEQEKIISIIHRNYSD